MVVEPHILLGLPTADLLRFYTRVGLSGHVVYDYGRYWTYGRYANGNLFNNTELVPVKDRRLYATH